MAKTIKKETVKKMDEVKTNDCEINKKLKNASEKLISEAVKLKKKFDKTDPKTQKKIITGLGAAAAGIAVLASLAGRKKKK